MTYVPLVAGEPSCTTLATVCTVVKLVDIDFDSHQADIAVRACVACMCACVHAHAWMNVCQAVRTLAAIVTAAVSSAVRLRTLRSEGSAMETQANMHTRTHARTHSRMCARTHAHTHTRTHAHTHTCMHAIMQ